MKQILSVATAGLYKDQLKDVEHRQFPRVDYIELQNRLHADTLDYSAYDNTIAGSLFRGIEKELRSDVYLAAITWWKSRAYSTVFTWSERAGIPFAGFRRVTSTATRLVTMFQSWSKRQESALTRLKLFPAMDTIIVHCPSMKQNLIHYGAPADKIKVIHYSIDQEFFSPRSDVQPEPGRIASLGETRSRNYAALFQAIAGLPVSLDVAGYGHWYAREKNDALSAKIPSNVTISRRLSHVELRDSYARSAFVVIPVLDLVYSAGATVALEAGSMARAVIAFRSRGIMNYIVDGETGLLIEPGDVDGLRAAIEHLLANPADAKRMGENARQRILEQFRLESYVDNIAEVLVRN